MVVIDNTGCYSRHVVHDDFQTCNLKEKKLNRTRISSLTSGILVIAGTWVLGISVHRFPLPALAGILVSAVGIVLYVNDTGELISIAGLSSWGKKVFPYSILGLMTGLGLGLFYGGVYNTPLVPATLTISAVLAPLIGITEELLFRGYVQGLFRGYYGWAGILAGAGGHAIYKVCVIGSYPKEVGADLLYLFLFTLAAGIVFGWLRKLAGNLLPAALGHAAFDLLIYGGLASLPGWVWY
jgi:membrane protease YdiL (CAAX protease family)